MRSRRTVQLPVHVHCVKSRGKHYYYYQPLRSTAAAGIRTRLFGEPTDPEWWEAYRTAASLKAPVERTDTFKALIKAYKESNSWKTLAEATRSEWTRYLQRIEDVWGTVQVKALLPKHVAGLQEKYAATPASANNLLKALTGMLSWAVMHGWRNDNPCREIPYLGGAVPYEAWETEMIDLARHKLPFHLWLPIGVAYYTGQRQSDVLTMPWSKLKNGLIEVKQVKTGKWVWIPVHRDLLPILDRAPRTADKVCTTSRGTAWACGRSYASSLALELKAREELAPLRSVVFHGLRKSAVTSLLEAGCSTAEAASITGQSMQMVEHYARDVNQRKLAVAAIAKWEAAA